MRCVAARPTSPSHALGVGPSLSPLKGGEGLFGWICIGWLVAQGQFISVRALSISAKPAVMRRAACLLALALLAGCGGGLAPVPGDRIRARFPPGGVVDVIEVDAIDRLPLRSAELVAPDGTATAAASIAVNPAPSETFSQQFPASPYTSAGFGFANIGADGTAPGGAGGVPQAQSRLLAMAATTSIAVPDPVAYRRGWRDYRIRLRFGDPPGAVERQIAAPEPPPGD